MANIREKQTIKPKFEHQYIYENSNINEIQLPTAGFLCTLGLTKMLEENVDVAF